MDNNVDLRKPTAGQWRVGAPVKTGNMPTTYSVLGADDEIVCLASTEANAKAIAALQGERDTLEATCDEMLASLEVIAKHGYGSQKAIAEAAIVKGRVCKALKFRRNFDAISPGVLDALR